MTGRADGSAAVTQALASLGIGTEALTADGDTAFGTRVLALANAETVSARVQRWDAQLAPGQLGVVVADRVTAAARGLLNEAGWGWLDLRGHLRIIGPGIVIDTDVPATGRLAPARSAFSGQVGRELAVLLLLAPDQPARIRAAAAELSRAPSSVSEALAAFLAGGLVDADRTPVPPDLFWALAEHWGSPYADVASVPAPGRREDNLALGINLHDSDGTVGWALTDTVAAAVYGAPVALRSDHPYDLFVPNRNTLRRAVQLLGPATSGARVARIRVAPVPAVCTRRVDAATWANQEWPVAHPLFVALDLAQDPGRGREILDGWTPPEPWRRVW